MTPEERKRHADIVQFYADHDQLDELLGSVLFEWYEPIVVTKKEHIKIGRGARIDSFVKLEGGSGLEIGARVHIASFAHLNTGGGSLIMGDGSCVASGGKIITGGNTVRGESMSAVAEEHMQHRDVHHLVIGRNAAILTNATLIKANMGEGAVLAAGAVALHDIPPFEIWGGVPARQIGLTPHHPSRKRGSR